MGYTVHLLSQESPVPIDAAASVSIDGDGELTVHRDDGVQLAMFARGAWAYAVNTDPGDKREQQVTAAIQPGWSLFGQPTKTTG